MSETVDIKKLVEDLGVGKDNFEACLKKQEEQKQKFKTLINSIKEMDETKWKEFQKINPYAVELARMQKESEELTAKLGDYKDALGACLAADKWYSEEYQKIQQNRKNLNEEDKQLAITSLENLYKQRKQEALEDVWEEHGEKIGNIFSDELYKVLTEYGDFEIGMKNITKRIYNYIIQESIKATIQQIFGIKAVNQMMTGLLSTASGIKSPVATGLIRGISKAVGFKFHSGGVMPVGANTDIPGTQEQLALLKGGERVLSPSENTSYNSNASSGNSPVVFNNYNIKAWDSKDVQKYLLENRDLLNSITYDGIKNNSNSLRQIVRYA